MKAIDAETGDIIIATISLLSSCYIYSHLPHIVFAIRVVKIKLVELSQKKIAKN